MSTVYIVDDDVAVRQSLALLVRSVGLQAEAFESGTAFLAAFSPAMAGCLIVDIRMPDHRCIRLLEDVKTIDPNVAVLIVSDGRDASDPFAQDMLSRYADGTLTKPFNAHALEESI